MAFSKAHHFPIQTYAFSLICKALAHPARVAIIQRILLNHNAYTQVADLSWGLPISPAAITQHLKILRDMYILDWLEDPPHVFYRLNENTPEVLGGIRILIAQLDKLAPTDAVEIELLGRRRRSGTSPPVKVCCASD